MKINNKLIEKNIMTISLAGGQSSTVSAYSDMKINFDTVSQIGSKLVFNSTNKSITIGAGVSKVLVSARCTYTYDTVSTGEAYLRIMKNAERYLSTVVGHGSGFVLNQITPILVDVSEGDEISAAVAVATAGKLGLQGRETYLTIEVID